MIATLPRIGLSLILAAGFSFGLFLLMQSLISSGGSVMISDDASPLADFVDVTRQEEVQTRRRQPQKPPAAPAPQPAMQAPKVEAQSLDGGSDVASFTDANIDITPDMSVDTGLGNATTSDGDYLPIVKIAPQYPRSAAQRKIEGYVVLEFTVTQQGSVKDIRVVEAAPPNVFDRAAITAARKFKYKPKVENGKAVDVTGVRNIIRFELDKSSRRS